MIIKQEGIRKKSYQTVSIAGISFSISLMLNVIMPSQRTFEFVLSVVGDRLAELRLKKGYSTIKEFAQVYDLPEIQYWRIEKGKANITLKSLFKILSIHNMSMEDFFCIIVEDEPIV
jgi:DNA-binding XRE family transcriptional regulator